MPYRIKKMGDKYRIVKKSTGKVAMRQGGGAVDGGGKASKDALKPQLTAMNMSYARKEGMSMPPPKKKSMPKKKKPMPKKSY